MILFVDDEARIMDSYLQYLRATMAPHSYEVTFLGDIDEAVAFFEEKTDAIDLIILDIMMPAGKFGSVATNDGLNTGLVFYERVRSQLPDLPIIIFTNFFGHEVDERFKRDSKCRFLQKVNYSLADFLLEVKESLSIPTT